MEKANSVNISLSEILEAPACDILLLKGYANVAVLAMTSAGESFLLSLSLRENENGCVRDINPIVSTNEKRVYPTGVIPIICITATFNQVKFMIQDSCGDGGLMW
jgi:hypothetical protein